MVDACLFCEDGDCDICIHGDTCDLSMKDIPPYDIWSDDAD